MKDGKLTLTLEVLPEEFSFCKVDNLSADYINKDFCFCCKTDKEVSLVCLSKDAPEGAIAKADGKRGFRIAGSLDFSLVGILADISSLLAENGISIFAVSTYDTDYIFTDKVLFDKALEILAENGYLIK